MDAAAWNIFCVLKSRSAAIIPVRDIKNTGLFFAKKKELYKRDDIWSPFLTKSAAIIPVCDVLIIGLFCKTALRRDLYSAKETYNFKEPANRSHPIRTCW